MINATLYEELRSGDRYERDEVKRPWTAGSKAPKTSWSSSRARAAELLIHASRAQAMPEHRGLQQQQQQLQQLQQLQQMQQMQQMQQRPLPKLSRPLSSAGLHPALSAPTLARGPASRPQSPERRLWQDSRPQSRQGTPSSGYGRRPSSPATRRRPGTPATVSSAHLREQDVLPEQLTRVVSEEWPQDAFPHQQTGRVPEFDPPPAVRKEALASLSPGNRTLQMGGCDEWLQGLQAERAGFTSHYSFSMYTWSRVGRLSAGLGVPNVFDTATACALLDSALSEAKLGFARGLLSHIMLCVYSDLSSWPEEPPHAAEEAAERAQTTTELAALLRQRLPYFELTARLVRMMTDLTSTLTLTLTQTLTLTLALALTLTRCG